MPSKKKQPKKVIRATGSVVTPLFDTALPVSLLERGISETLKPGIRLHTSGPSPLSPYIIELSRKQTTTARVVDHSKDQIAELARQLAQVEDDYEAIDSQVPSESGLSISLQELSGQLRESEHITSRPLPTFRQAQGALSASKSKGELEGVANTIYPSQLPELEISGFDVWSVLEERDNHLDEYNEERSSREDPSWRRDGSDRDPQEHRIINSETLIERFSRIHLLLPKQARHRAMAVFFVLSFILVMPLHAMQGIMQSTNIESEVTQMSAQALSEIERATSSAQSQDFAAASLDFERASESFENAQDSLHDMHLAAAALVSIIPQTDRTLKTVDGLVRAGSSLSKAAALLTAAIERLSQNDSYSLTTKLGLLTTYVEQALPEIVAANQALIDVNADLVPVDYQEKIALLLDNAPRLEQSMEEFLRFSQTLQTLLGGEQKMRYLLTFQNNAELRATGGFIGSIAQVDMLNGEIQSISIPSGGSYDMQGQLTEYIAPPEPLSLINARWELQDANWFADFPSSSKKLLGFYEAAGGPTLDGVLAINASVMPNLLEILGPIDMPEYDRAITAENFLFETQKIVECEYANYANDDLRTEDAPKQFIGDLAPKILERLSEADPQTLLAVLDLFSSSLQEKDVLVYIQDNDLQKDVEALGWSGALKQTDGDYLMVVNTNLGGGKTDTVIKQDIDVEIEIQNDGSIINTVTITKEHTGLSSALFEGVNNVDYIRLYVPLGSELISATGFEIPDEDLFKTSSVNLQTDNDMALWTNSYATDMVSGTDVWNELGKTVFGNWIQTKPGEIETVTFSYKLPFVFDSSEDSFLTTAKEYLGIKQLNQYSLLIQKQPGVETRTSTIHVSGAHNHQPIWMSQTNLMSTGIEVDNAQDHFFSVIFEQQ